MQINIKDYQEFNTPYDYSYCPDENLWYKDEEGLMPEPKSKPTEIENFVLNDILGSSDNTKTKNQKEFQDFIAYNFGVQNGEDCFGFSILNIPQFPNSNDDLAIEISIHYFDDVLEFAEEIEQGENSCKYLESFSGIKFFGWQKENNKVRFTVQKYNLNTDYKTDFIFSYDVLVDKDQLISELKRVVNKYKNKVKTAIKRYEKKNFARFTNLMQDKCLEEWLNLKDGTYNDWKATKFITATELEKYINKIKPQLIGKPLNNVIITGNMFNPYDEFNLERIDGKYYQCMWIDYNEDFSEGTLKAYLTDYDPDNLEEYSCELDEPIILKIGEDIQLEVEFHEHSLVQIGINTLKEGDYTSFYGYPWRDISSRFKKNLIGHTVKDIYITKTKLASISWQVRHENGDDMYNSVTIVFDNDYKFVIGIDCAPDYMLISEVASGKEQEN